jgi:hypothetical protein
MKRMKVTKKIYATWNNLFSLCVLHICRIDMIIHICVPQKYSSLGKAHIKDCEGIKHT